MTAKGFGQQIATKGGFDGSYVIESSEPISQAAAAQLREAWARWEADPERTGPIVLAKGMTLRHIDEAGHIEPSVVHMPDALAVRLVAVLGFIGIVFAFIAGFLLGGMA